MSDNHFSANAFTILDAIEELERELKCREELYPKWIEAARLNPVVAEARFRKMRLAIKYLKRAAGVPDKPAQNELALQDQHQPNTNNYNHYDQE